MKRAAKKSTDPFPERISPQLATLVSAPPTRGAWTYEIKLDGYRILSRCGGGVVRLFTRNENDWTSKMVSLAQELAALPAETAWFDGEVVVLGENGIPNFNALQNAFDTRGTESLTYFVFDLLYLNGKDLRGLEFRQRRELLAALFAENDSERVRLSQTFDADGQSVLQSACKMGLEGVIAKRLDAPYKSTRTDAWLKVKCQLRQEFVVGGFVTRTGSTSEVGSLMLGVYDDDGRLRSVGSVGTGWDSKTATTMLRTLEPLEIDKSAFDPEFAPTKGRWSRRPAGGERWVRPVAVVEVSFTEWTPDGHIRHPKFHGARYDKPAESIRREATAAWSGH
jgi:bifunctional non-homologous end joining protein LigD